MKTYILPIFTLLIVGCGNQSQPSNDAILDDVTQNSNGETENLDSIRVFVRCKEKAKIFFDKEEYTHRALDTSSIHQCYENKYAAAFVDSLEKIFQPYKERLITSVDGFPYIDRICPKLALEFAQDTCWLHTYYNYQKYIGFSNRYMDAVTAKYQYVRLRRMADKYYRYLLICDESADCLMPPKLHKQWVKSIESDMQYCSPEQFDLLYEMIEQRIEFYYNECQYRIPWSQQGYAKRSYKNCH